jgi:hypothetical protein
MITEGHHEKRTKAYSPEERVSIQRQDLVEKVPVSNVCEKAGRQSTVFYRWFTTIIRELMIILSKPCIGIPVVMGLSANDINL